MNMCHFVTIVLLMTTCQACARLNGGWETLAEFTIVDPSVDYHGSPNPRILTPYNSSGIAGNPTRLFISDDAAYIDIRAERYKEKSRKVFNGSIIFCEWPYEQYSSQQVKGELPITIRERLDANDMKRNLAQSLKNMPWDTLEKKLIKVPKYELEEYIDSYGNLKGGWINYSSTEKKVRVGRMIDSYADEMIENASYECVNT